MTSSPVARLPGLHLLGDLYGCCCEPHAMHDDRWLAEHCRQLVADAGLTAVGCLFHRFGEQAGVTGMVVLAESHLSLHTWPEEGYVTVDVYVCNHSADNRARAQCLFDALVATFGPQEPHLRRIDRV